MRWRSHHADRITDVILLRSEFLQPLYEGRDFLVGKFAFLVFAKRKQLAPTSEAPCEQPMSVDELGHSIRIDLVNLLPVGLWRAAELGILEPGLQFASHCNQLLL